MVTKLLLYAADKKKITGKYQLISFQTYAAMLLNMFGRVVTFSLKSYSCLPRLQTEFKQKFKSNF